MPSRPGEPAAGDADAVRTLIHGMYAAFAEGRPDAVEAALHPDCTVWDVFTPHLIRGKEERHDFHAADQRQKNARGPLTWQLGDLLVDVWGDTAVARYELAFRYEPPNATDGTVRITDVLRRDGGGWLIVHHHEGLIPEGPPPTHEPH